MSDKLTHTPGPWKLNAGVIEALVDPENSQSYIAPICDVDMDWSTEIYKANAHLIAAAPELLEALKSLLEASRELDQSATHDGLNNCKAITQARAAIRKAEEGAI